MFTKFAVGALVSGTLVLGTAGMAFASTPTSSAAPSTPASSQFNCANATKALTRIQKIEARINAGLPKLTAAEQKASSNGHTKLAARLQKRITPVREHDVQAASRHENAEDRDDLQRERPVGELSTGDPDRLRQPG